MTKSNLRKLKTKIYQLERCLSPKEIKRISVSKRIVRIKKQLNHLIKENKNEI